MALDEIPATLIEAVKYFSDLENCNVFMREIKWPGGKIICPKCEHDSCSPIKRRPQLQCNSCRKQFSYKTGTIFEDSPLGLDKWFVAVWFVANCKNGISSHELGRALGVSQKTAWFMTHRVRKAAVWPQLATADSWAKSERIPQMAKAKKKPAGFGNFSNLMRKLAKVPKAHVDAAVAASKRKRRKK